MSKATIKVQTVNSLIVDYDYRKIFVFGNRYETGIFNNATGGALDYAAGVLVGRITATDKIVPLVSGAGDGSEIPVGVLKSNITQLAGGGDIPVSICIGGDVVRDLLILDAGDTLETIIGGRRLKDRITSDNLGIKLVNDTNHTDFDNA